MVSTHQTRNHSAEVNTPHPSDIARCHLFFLRGHSADLVKQNDNLQWHQMASRFLQLNSLPAASRSMFHFHLQHKPERLGTPKLASSSLPQTATGKWIPTTTMTHIL